MSITRTLYSATHHFILKKIVKSEKDNLLFNIPSLEKNVKNDIPEITKFFIKITAMLTLCLQRT